MDGPVVCLLPARDAAKHLHDWFASVEVFADAVVALDDGSTDGTRELLARHPLVAEVLANPVRPTVAGWDDAANRARLLAAAGALAPAWIVQLDADERIPADDARALRAFLTGGASREHAYSMRVYRMIGDLDHYDAEHDQWVARCFPYHPDHRLPTARLHFSAVPTAFPPDRRRRTTFRIQHLAALTPADRRRQFEKYRLVDPERRFQRGYAHLLREPHDVREWVPRSPALGALVQEPVPPPPGTPPAACSLTVIVDAVDRDHALRSARGDFVAAPAGTPEAGWADAILRAHHLGYAMVSGVARTDATSAAGWADYLLEHYWRLPGTPSGPLDRAPTDCSYARAAIPERRTDDELFARGYSAYLASDAVTVVPEQCTTVGRLVRRSFRRGRDRGRGVPVRTMLRSLRAADPQVRSGFARRFPILVVGVVAEWCGAAHAVVSRRRATGRPGERRAAVPRAR